MFSPSEKYRKGIWSLALVLICAASSAFSVPPPGSNFDLTHWKLTLPLDVVGGTSGTAAEISSGQLVAGYTNNYFYSGSDGAMIFWCPVNGATTSGSTYPRSELREMVNPNDSSVNWLGTGTHILRAQCKITQQPSAGANIIGQVHGYSYSQRLVKLQVNNGVVQAYVRNSPTTSGDTKFTYPTVPLNGIINYEIKVVDGVASIAVNGVTNSFNFFASNAAWQTINYYFKAGSYVQDNSGTETEGGRVSFYQLSITHGTPQIAPTITTQPISQTVAPGGSVTLRTVASGTALLAYQWRADSVAVPGGTNASLSIANFRATDQKRYDVVVTNPGGSVTSAAATLYLNTPLRFINQGLNTSRRFNTTLLGVPNTTYVVESSTDMRTWTPLLTNSSPTGIINFTDPNPSAGARYYRAR